ncbi:MAG TPA: hypothetical protein VKR31_05195 [Rhizomicrobium sp.]|nr:hypothetical protein [Rhizomicrobium sp.]
MRIARVARAATSPTFRTTARSIRVMPLSKSTDARVAEVTASATCRSISREIFLGARRFDVLAATARLAPFDAGFFRLTALGATLRVLGAAFFIFFLDLANVTDLLRCSIATASSH